MRSVLVCSEDLKKRYGVIQGGDMLHACKAPKFALDLGSAALVIFAGVFGSGKLAPDSIQCVLRRTRDKELPAWFE
jgi:hypothetical protein